MKILLMAVYNDKKQDEREDEAGDHVDGAAVQDLDGDDGYE